MSRTIRFETTPDGAALTMDGDPFVRMALTSEGMTVTLPSVDTPHVAIVRDRSVADAATDASVTIDGSRVTSVYPDRPTVTLTRDEPDTDPDTATPTGTRPLYGQDAAMHEVMTAIANGENALLRGPTGCGKTDLVRRACEYVGASFVLVSCDPDTRKGDLIGENVIDPDPSGDTAFPLVFQPGPVTNAVKRSQTRRTVLFIDEPNRVDAASVFACLYGVLDASRTLSLGSGVYEPVGDLIVMAAINPADDERTAYDVREMDPALMDRFQTTIPMAYPSTDVEARALVERVPGLDPDMAHSLALVARAVREAQAVSYPFGFRTLAAWAKRVASGYDPLTAAGVTFLPKAPVEDREALTTFVQTRFPQGV